MAYVRLKDDASGKSTLEPIQLKDSISWPLKSMEEITVTTDAEDDDSLAKSVILQQDDSVPAHWKPLSLSPLILIAVITLTVLIAAAIEVLAQESKTEGGLALSASQEAMPVYAKLSYLYGPNIVAVLYSLIWNWIDLDTKRMQPWFELSKPSGATAENSLFLDYPYDFVAFVPWKAARRRHWPVFLSGTTMMIVFWAITPLQSAILGTGTVMRTERVRISQRSGLVPVEQQEALLDPRVLNTGYAVGWLGQPFPPFMTADYAVLPFWVDDDAAPDKVSSSLTASTTMLSTELHCWTAEVFPTTPEVTNTFHFLNGQGCNTSIALNTFKDPKMLYVGYYSSPYSDFSLGSSGSCPESSNATHQILAIWAKPTPASPDNYPDYNITALFCQPYYYQQEIEVSISPKLYPEPNSIISKSEKIPLSDTEFNTTAFEYLLVNGMPEEPGLNEFPYDSVIEQHPRLYDMNLMKPVSNMVGFALAGQNRSTDDYSNPVTLQQSFNRAHKYLFSIAVNTLSANRTDVSNRTAASTFPLHGIVVSRPFSASVEALLLLVAALTGFLLWLCICSPSNLSANPSSISRLAEIFRNSPELLKSFHNLDRETDESLRDSFKGRRFKLSATYESGYRSVSLEEIQNKAPSSSVNENSCSETFYKPARPLALRREMGVFFVIVLSGMMIGLSIIQWQVLSRNGLQRPTDNFEILQLLENYIPTILATFIEPFWVLLNRFLCMIQPFKALWKTRSKQSTSVNTTYTSVPPPLAILRAIKSSHWLLASVCLITLLANVLAVGLGALFNEEGVFVRSNETAYALFDSKFSNSSIFEFPSYLSKRLITSATYQDHMYITMANLTEGTPLPPWTSSEYFFQPYDFVIGTNETFAITTQGFGVRANCTSAGSMSVPVNVPEEQLESNGTICAPLIETAAIRLRRSTLTRPEGAAAIEYSNTASRTTAVNSCDKALTFGWARTPQGQNMNATVDASFAICRPVFQTGLFKVIVDAHGYVLSYKDEGPITSNLDYEQSGTHTDALIVYSNHLINSPDIHWHNDTLSRSWMAYFIPLLVNSKDSLDPKKPVPAPEDLLPAIEDIYRRIFATLLSQNQHLFEETKATVFGTKQGKETRIFMDQPAFVITMVVLGLNIIVAVVYYCWAVMFVLPRMPTTIGSILAYIAPSRGVKLYNVPTFGMAERTVSFGRYIGTDGKEHVGIELDPHVLPIHQSSLRKKSSFAEHILRRRTRANMAL